MKILLLGATGLVGGHVLQQALAHSDVTQVIAPVRKALSIQHDKLLAPVINFDDFEQEAKSWQFDAVICALGTTMKKAKTKDAFKKIDFEYPLAFAQLAKSKGMKIYALNSAMGVSANSPIFYNKVKGELEDALRDLNFEQLVLVRPGLIDGDRAEVRLGEHLALKVSKWVKPILPKSMQPSAADKIAKALLDGVLIPNLGVQIISSDELA